MAQTALVYGGSGALGKGLVTAFKANAWRVIAVDLVANAEADHNVTLQFNDAWATQAEAVDKSVGEILAGGKLNAILCVAGGWAGGNAASADFLANTELMVKQSVYSSVIAAQIAARHLAEGGLLTLTGAAAATDATPGMIGYGLAKAAVHQLTKSLGAAGSGLPAGAGVVAILPKMLDTPANRKFADANTDFGTWTPISAIATQVLAWADGKDRPASGALIRVETVGGNTSFVSV